MPSHLTADPPDRIGVQQPRPVSAQEQGGQRVLPCLNGTRPAPIEVRPKKRSLQLIETIANSVPGQLPCFETRS